MSAAADVEARAALWLVRREEPDWSDADQAALDAWLDEAIAHKAAYWRLEHGWRAGDRIGALRELPRPRARPGWWRVAAAAALLVAASFGALRLLPGGPAGGGTAPQERYATAVGGHHMLALADGSRVELNTATAVRSGVTTERREFWLDRGEAYFEVAHAPDRPFVVHAGPRTITVLGTKFSVRREGDRVSVAVLEGRVRVEQAARSGGTSAGSATITGGEVALADGASTLVTANADERVRQSLSWRQGLLSFDRSTLAEAAAEFNRYNRRQIVIDDAETRAIRIGGTFQAANVDAFIRLLRDAYGLRVETHGDETRISG